jgi:hypothetical protein
MQGVFDLLDRPLERVVVTTLFQEDDGVEMEMVVVGHQVVWATRWWITLYPSLPKAFGNETNQEYTYLFTSFSSLPFTGHVGTPYLS